MYSDEGPSTPIRRSPRRPRSSPGASLSSASRGDSPERTPGPGEDSPDALDRDTREWGSLLAEVEARSSRRADVIRGVLASIQTPRVPPLALPVRRLLADEEDVEDDQLLRPRLPPPPPAPLPHTGDYDRFDREPYSSVSGVPHNEGTPGEDSRRTLSSSPASWGLTSVGSPGILSPPQRGLDYEPAMTSRPTECSGYLEEQNERLRDSLNRFERLYDTERIAAQATKEALRCHESDAALLEGRSPGGEMLKVQLLETRRDHQLERERLRRELERLQKSLKEARGRNREECEAREDADARVESVQQNLAAVRNEMQRRGKDGLSARDSVVALEKRLVSWWELSRWVSLRCTEVLGEELAHVDPTMDDALGASTSVDDVKHVVDRTLSILQGRVSCSGGGFSTEGILPGPIDTNELSSENADALRRIDALQRELFGCRAENEELEALMAARSDVQVPKAVQCRFAGWCSTEGADGALDGAQGVCSEGVIRQQQLCASEKEAERAEEQVSALRMALAQSEFAGSNLRQRYDELVEQKRQHQKVDDAKRAMLQSAMDAQAQTLRDEWSNLVEVERQHAKEEMRQLCNANEGRQEQKLYLDESRQIADALQHRVNLMEQEVTQHQEGTVSKQELAQELGDLKKFHAERLNALHGECNGELMAMQAMEDQVSRQCLEEVSRARAKEMELRVGIRAASENEEEEAALARRAIRSEAVAERGRRYIAIGELRKEIHQELEGKALDELREQVREELFNEIRTDPRNEFRQGLARDIRQELRDQLRSELRSELQASRNAASPSGSSQTHPRWSHASGPPAESLQERLFTTAGPSTHAKHDVSGKAFVDGIARASQSPSVITPSSTFVLSPSMSIMTPPAVQKDRKVGSVLQNSGKQPSTPNTGGSSWPIGELQDAFARAVVATQLKEDSVVHPSLRRDFESPRVAELTKPSNGNKERGNTSLEDHASNILAAVTRSRAPWASPRAF